MAKFYVESGPSFLAVIEARDSTDALCGAFTTAESTAPMCLADVFIVNERGFVWHREGHELYGDEVVIPTELILGRPEIEA